MDFNYFSEKTFQNQNFSGSKLDKGEYELCVFQNCDLSDADLSDLRFLESEFVDCNLSNAKLHKTAFQDTQFRNCKMLGLSFDEINDFSFSATFENCQLDHASFYQKKLGKSTFLSCSMHGVDLTESDVSSGRLIGCNLTDAIFDQTNLENADLSDSTNFKIDPDTNRIRGARFSLPDVLGLLDKYNINVNK